MNRLKGYDRHFKGRFLFLQRKLLSDKEYVLWDLSFSCLADWDKSHGDTYGSFQYALREIGWLIGWSASKVSRNTNKLYSLGLWTKRNGRVFVNGFDIRDNLAQISRDKKIIDLQEYVSILQPTVAKPQPPVADLRQKTPKGNGVASPQSVAILQQPRLKASLVSFKSEFNVLRSNEEYFRMWEENPDGLSIEDMKWIDRNV